MSRKIKRVPIHLDLLFDEGLSKEEVLVVARNLSDAIHRQIMNVGIAPQMSEANTTEVRIMIPGTVLIIEKLHEDGDRDLTEELL